MRAATYSRTGAAKDVLSITELPRPEPGPGEVRVRIAWSGINPSDTKARAGTRSPTMPFPSITPHSDGAGIVDAVGAGVSPSRAGQRVWVWNAAWGRPDGTAAEWVVLPSEQAVLLPDGVDLEVGAALGIPALTAYHAVALGSGVAGKTVLVAGGAGAVGHYAVQMAKRAGARQVIATVGSEAKGALARSAGADLVLNYRESELSRRVMEATDGRGVDRIIEVDMAANAADDFAMVAPGGEIVVYGSGEPQMQIPFGPAILKNVVVAFFIVYNLSSEDRKRAVDGITTLLEAGALQHNIPVRLPLEKIVEGHELVETGRAGGNVVLDLR